jgi:hypothetical protein
MAKFKRRQLFVDSKVQGAVVLRLLGYGLVTFITTTSMILIWRMTTGPRQPLSLHFADLWIDYGPALIASLLLVPLIVIDCVRLTNRFAGPLYRMRRSLRDLAMGVPVSPIYFREADFWQDIADEFNAVSAKLQRIEAELAELRGHGGFDDEVFESAAPAKR